MPTQTYEITAPNGKTLEVTGDHVPSEAELHTIFAQAGVATGAAPPPAVAPPPASTNPFDAMRGQTLADLPEEQARTQAGVQILPSVGGAIGGLVGGIPGAAAGGAIGDLARQALQPAPATPLSLADRAKSVAVSGAVQGAAEGAGQLLGAAATKSSTWLMNRAVNATDRLSREFPELSQTLIDNSIAVSQGGLNKARKLLMAAKAMANGALQTAEAKGVTIPVTAATSGLSDTLDEVMNSGDPVGGLKALAKAETNITTGRAADLTPTAADALKTSLQRQSRQLYLAAKMGNGSPGLAVAAEAKADMAGALNDAIEQATSGAGAPGYKAANHSAQDLIGATRGITKAIRPGSNLYQAMVRPGVGAVLGGAAGSREGTPGALAGMAAGAALTSPYGLSMQALTLAHPAMQTVIRQLPKALAAAFSEWQAQHSATAPAPSGSPTPAGQ